MHTAAAWFAVRVALALAVFLALTWAKKIPPRLAVKSAAVWLAMRVVVFLAVFAALSLWSAWATRKGFWLPPLPAFARLSTEGVPPGSFCSSVRLRKRLNERFYHYTGRSERLAPDLSIACEIAGAKARFTVRDAAGKLVGSVSTVYDPHAFDASAYVAVSALEHDPAVVRAALEAYNRDLRFAYVEAGSDAFAAKDWKRTAELLYKGLESDAPPAVLYFGLYAAHASLGHQALARWYLLAFCASDGKKPSQLTERQLSYLVQMQSAGLDVPAKPYDWMGTALLILDQKWSWLLNEDKASVEAAPWSDRLCDRLAAMYRNLGWDPLAENWRRRAELARRIDADAVLNAELAALTPRK